MSNQAVLILFGIIFLPSAVVSGIIVFRALTKGKQIEIITVAGEPFEMVCAPMNAKEYRLWARYSLDWTQGGRNGYSLVFDLKVTVDGALVYEDKLGIGQETPESNDYVSGPEYFSNSVSSPSSNHRTASIAILKLGPRPLNSEIVVTGKVIEVGNTSAGPTKLYVAR
jgi:hypothetical protein